MDKDYLFKKYPKIKKVYHNLIMNSDIQGLVIVNVKKIHHQENLSRHSIKKAVKQLYHNHLLNAVDLSNNAYTIPKVTNGFIKALHQVRHSKATVKSFAKIAKKSSKALSRSNHDIKRLLVDLKKHRAVIAKLKSNNRSIKSAYSAKSHNELNQNDNQMFTL